jgi:hypothetical protein
VREPGACGTAQKRRCCIRCCRRKKHGREVDPELGEVDDSTEASALTACYSAAAAGTDLFGERAGSPALRLVDPSLARPHEPVAIAYGVNRSGRVQRAARVNGGRRSASPCEPKRRRR